MYSKKSKTMRWNFVLEMKKLEIVDKFTYLYNGNMTKAVYFLTVVAYINLLYTFDIKMKLSFFDKLVVPILTYCFIIPLLKYAYIKVIR